MTHPGPAGPPAADASPRVRLVNKGGPDAAALLARVNAQMADAVGAVERFWGSDWDREIVVVATGSTAQFAAESRLDARGEWADIAAVAVADSVDLDRRQATGQRIVLAPGAAGMSDAAVRVVLAHELFHLAARVDTAVDAPRWLTEGVADFVARPPGPVPSEAPLPIPPEARAVTALPTDADLDRAGPARSAGYDRAWWFARFVADTEGVAALQRLYVAACGPGHGDIADAVRGALGVDLAELKIRWAAWLNR